MEEKKQGKKKPAPVVLEVQNIKHEIKLKTKGGE
jgi:hypothetical protein